MYRLPVISCPAYVRAGLSRLLAVGCSIVLAASLVPIAPAFAEEAPPAEPDSPSIDEMLDAGSYLEGEALVVYRADAAQPRARSFAAVDPLAAAGFAVEESWDFTQTNAAVNLMSLDEGASDDDSGATIARVTKEGANTSELLEELQDIDGVLAVAPNYVHKMVEPAEAQFETPSALPIATLDNSSNEEPKNSPSNEEPSIIEGTEVSSVNESFTPVSDDPLVGLQWSLANTLSSDDGTPANSSVDLAAVYEDALQGTENIVAVIDTGVDFDNEDLSDAMWENPGDIPGVPGKKGTHGYDFADNDDDPRPADTSVIDSHGTHCAGIVAASSNNGTGISGVAPNTKIMALRIGGGSLSGNINDAIIIASYEYIVRAKLAGENVVAASNSWEDLLSPVTEYVINQAGRAGVLSVFAAGNKNSDLNTVGNQSFSYHYSDSPYILTVSATTPLGTYAEFSNHGQTVSDVGAPGSIILSTVPQGTQNFLPAVAKLLDQQDGTQNTRSLYYHSLVDFADESSGARIELMAGGKAVDAQERMSLQKGSGLDGREALKISVENMTQQEYVMISWRIENPFKTMTLEEAQRVRIAVLPGVSFPKDTTNNASLAYVKPFILSDDGKDVTLANLSMAKDTMSLGPVGFKNRELFESIQDQATVEVGMLVGASADDLSGDTTSFTVTDFGIGFPSKDQSYDYMSGTSMACPLVAGVVGALASIYPNDSALDLRGRIAGGTRELHDASSEAFSGHRGNYDATGKVKQTASNGTVDLAVAASDGIHPNLWSAREGSNAQGQPAVVLEGYNLARVDALFIDESPVSSELWEVDSRGSQMTVMLANLLDGGRHTIKVTDGVATHTSAFTFPKIDQRLAFERVADLPDAGFPGQVGFDPGILIAASDRVFCLDAKGRFLYAYDPEGSKGWEPRTSPSDAGLDISYFRAHTSAVYANGKLYMLVYTDTESGDSEAPYRTSLGLVSYDIASDTWDTNVLEFAHKNVDSAGSYFLQVGLASREGSIYCTFDTGSGRSVAVYDPSTGDLNVLDLEKADPEGSFRALTFGWSVSSATVGDELRFVGFTPTRVDEPTGKPLEYALTFGVYDGTTLSAMQPGDDAPRFSADESDALEAAARQAIAASGDSVVFAGASAEGLGDTYQVNATTGEWTSLGVKAPEGGWAAVSTACFYRGSYYVLAASTGENDLPTTSLYRLPSEVVLTPNDHTATAQATEGGKVEVQYGAPLPRMRAAMAASRALAGSSQVTRVALGDTVTWTAVPNEGYTFAGWYDQDGSLISKDAVYQQPVTTDVTLTARFASSAGPTPPTPAPDPDVPPSSTGSDIPSNDRAPGGAEVLAPTGDTTGSMLGALALLAIAGFAACAVARAKGRKSS